ncbi:hypothetical protein FBU30_006485 [Linnemannia zychae]|nr:hypothetical protein FBU30_006485 [Linnemannia zychae]
MFYDSSSKYNGQFHDRPQGDDESRAETNNIAIKRRPSKASQHILHNTQDFNKFLQERPPPKELVEKNILKDTKVAPALQQHAEELKKSQLEDTLNSKLEHRPPASELIDHNILHDLHVSPALQKQTEELKRSQLEDKLAGKIETRPRPSKLIEQHILHASDVDPALQDRNSVDASKNTPVENLPSPRTLAEKQNILV